MVTYPVMTMMVTTKGSTMNTLTKKTICCHHHAGSAGPQLLPSTSANNCACFTVSNGKRFSPQLKAVTPRGTDIHLQYQVSVRGATEQSFTKTKGMMEELLTEQQVQLLDEVGTTDMAGCDTS